jgi:hypothetical protein
MKAIERAIDPRAMVERRNHFGGVAPIRVKEQIARSREQLEHDNRKVKDKRVKLAKAINRLEKAIDAIINK